MDLERFYKECSEILEDIDTLEQDEKKERFVAITTRATEYKQTLLNLRNDLIPLEQGGNEEGPQSLLEEDTSNAPFFITSDNIPRATIVCSILSGLGHCADSVLGIMVECGSSVGLQHGPQCSGDDYGQGALTPSVCCPVKY